MSDNVRTPDFRASYPNLFKAKKNELNGKDEYSVVALFKKGQDLSVLKAAATAAIELKWGKDKAKWPSQLKSPFRDQGDRAKTDENGRKVLPGGYEDGAIFMTLKSDQRPGMVDQNVVPIIDTSEVYAGVFLRATIRFYAYDHKGNRGVGCGLQNIQKVKDGDPISGRVKAEDDFAPVPKEMTESATGLFD